MVQLATAQDGREQRSLKSPIELRADKEFGGLAVLYYDGTPATEFQLAYDIRERVWPGAFSEFLASEEDCFALYDHDPKMLLGRRSSGTLRIDNQQTGLAYAIPYDSTDPTHQMVWARIKRRDVRGSSVIWRVTPDGEDYVQENGVFVRNIRKAWLFDIGPTPVPAYTNTTAELRHISPETAAVIRARAQAALQPAPLDVEFWRPD